MTHNEITPNPGMPAGTYYKRRNGQLKFWRNLPIRYTFRKFRKMNARFEANPIPPKPGTFTAAEAAKHPHLYAMHVIIPVEGFEPIVCIVYDETKTTIKVGQMGKRPNHDTRFSISKKTGRVIGRDCGIPVFELNG